MSLGTYKVVLLGEGRVGKTSIASRFVDDKFDSGQISTVQANMYSKKRIPVEGTLDAGKSGERSKGRKYVDIALWDTAGQERYHALGPIYYRNANGAVLVYDITDADTFERIRMWIKELRQVVGDNIHIVICGNKSDLEKEREVNLAMAEKFARAQGASHFSTSAKTNDGVGEAFQCLVQSILVSQGLIDPEGANGGAGGNDEDGGDGDDGEETVAPPRGSKKSGGSKKLTSPTTKRGGVKISLDDDEDAGGAESAAADTFGGSSSSSKKAGGGKKKGGAKIADDDDDSGAGPAARFGYDDYGGGSSVGVGGGGASSSYDIMGGGDRREQRAFGDDEYISGSSGQKNNSSKPAPPSAAGARKQQAEEKEKPSAASSSPNKNSNSNNNATAKNQPITLDEKGTKKNGKDKKKEKDCC